MMLAPTVEPKTELATRPKNVAAAAVLTTEHVPKGMECAAHVS